jgi:UDP-N-acetylmuramate--alanine ligase
MDSYRDMADVEDCFVEFMNKVPFYGAVTVCADDPRLRAILPRVHRRVYTYGLSPEADFRLRMLAGTLGAHARFEVNAKGLVLGPFELHVPGRHNVMNAVAAVAIGVQLGIAPEQIAAGLATFRGVNRRFQTLGVVGGVTVVDDYGHHPTEVRATLQAARECGYGRVLVLFQPHRYTRTRDLMTEFTEAFGDADALQVLDIYAASEQPIAGVNGEGLAAAIRAVKGKQGGGRVVYAASMEEGVQRLVEDARPGDMVLTLGAGSVAQAGPMLLECLKNRG